MNAAPPAFRFSNLLYNSTAVAGAAQRHTVVLEQSHDAMLARWRRARGKLLVNLDRGRQPPSTEPDEVASGTAWSASNGRTT